MKVKNFCVWKFDDEYEMYSTSCGTEAGFSDGDKKEDDYKFCPYCGLPIKEKKK